MGFLEVENSSLLKYFSLPSLSADKHSVNIDKILIIYFYFFQNLYICILLRDQIPVGLDKINVTGNVFSKYLN